MDVSTGSKSLPENAYRKLKPGEKYTPVVPAETIVPEITGYSLIWGLVFAVLFSAAAAYLGLKIGQVFEAAIPITILAIGVSAGLGKKNALQQNVMIQSIGSASGVVVAGAIFTLPGIYILGLDDQTNFLQMCLASLLGGFLGILLLIPFRRYFVKDMHGEFPFPEATASTEVLMAGEAGGDQAAVLVKSGGIAMRLPAAQRADLRPVARDLQHHGLQVRRERSRRNVRLEFNMMTEAAILGLGYIIGLRYVADHRLRLVPELVGAGPDDRHPGQGRARGRRALPAAGPGRPEHDGDLPQLRAAGRHRRHRHVRHDRRLEEPQDHRRRHQAGRPRPASRAATAASARTAARPAA